MASTQVYPKIRPWLTYVASSFSVLLLGGVFCSWPTVDARRAQVQLDSGRVLELAGVLLPLWCTSATHQRAVAEVVLCPAPVVDPAIAQAGGETP